MGTAERSVGVRADRLAFVQSTWHEEIVDRCRDSFLAEIEALGVERERIDLWLS